jgi:gluconolactonase
VAIPTIYGVEELEAPVCLEDGGAYLVEMSQRKRCVTHVSPSGAMRTVITLDGRPNGLALNGHDNIWIAVAGDAGSSVTCCSPTGEILAVISGGEDGPFLWPNGLAFGPNGLLYVTDSGIRVKEFIEGTTIRPDVRAAPYDGRIYEIDPTKAVVVRTLDRGIRFTNGIASGSDDRMYVSETMSGDVFRYDIGSAVPSRAIFGNVVGGPSSNRLVGPDGMKFGDDGRLYCTLFGDGVVAVLDRDGALVDHIPVDGSKPTNIAFLREGREALVTEVAESMLQSIAVLCGGLALHYPTVSVLKPSQQH